MTAATLHGQLALFDAQSAALLEDRVPSDGLTLDTPDGPVDLVAVERALAGERIALTYAERAYTARLFKTPVHHREKKGG